jgi:hypothetical protein
MQKMSLNSPLDAALKQVDPDRRQFLGMLLAGVAALPLLSSSELSAEGGSDQKNATSNKTGSPQKGSNHNLKNSTQKNSTGQKGGSPQKGSHTPLKSSASPQHKNPTSPVLKH